MIDVWSVTPDNKQAPHTGTIDTEWAENYLNEILNDLHSLPIHNVCKPGSQFFICLLKICSLIKGSHLGYRQTLQQVQAACIGHSLTEKDIEYQFKRAYQRAKPLIRGAC